MKNLPAQLILILGGARSGKSTYAEKLAADMGQAVVYIATAEAKDEEMVARIEMHRRTRPGQWQTIEAPRQVAAALSHLNNQPEVLLLDCLTLLVSNLVLDMETHSPATIETAIQAELETILAVQKKFDVPLIVVSNEVGLGLVPPYPLGRVYRDVLGRTNQHLAALADKVVLMVAGLPIMIKGED